MANDKELEEELRRAHEERTPFGRLMPDAALKQAEAWIDGERRREKLDAELAERRAKQLRTPIVIFVEEREVVLDRLLYEKLDDQIHEYLEIGERATDTLSNILTTLVNAGIIEIK